MSHFGDPSTSFKGYVDLANALTTVVLAVFAFVQLVTIAVDRRDRIRTAYASARIEFWRLWSVSETWRQLDLEEAAEIGFFEPRRILPPDWGGVLSVCGQLGTLPARLIGIAYGYASLAAERAVVLVRLVEERSRQVDSATSDIEKAAIKVKFAPPISEQLSKARKFAHQAAETFEDSFGSMPRWLKRERVDLSGLSSEFAVQVRERASKRLVQNPPLGVIGRVVGRCLRACASWLDPD